MLRRLYRRAFVDRIQAVTGRFDTLIAEVMTLRGELMALRSEVREVQARQERLERHIETVIAGGWDTTALSRRLAAIEDRSDEP